MVQRGPRGLSRAQIRRAFAGARTSLAACRGAVTGGKAGDRIQLTVTVLGSGKVAGVKVHGSHARTKVGGCVAAAVRGITFPGSEHSTDRFRHTVEL
jgi:hypothetical protein